MMNDREDKKDVREVKHDRDVDDFGVDDMNCIERTKLFYPEAIKHGWCWATNVSKKRRGKGLDKKDIKEIISQTISFYSHMKPTNAAIGWGKPAYWSDGSVDNTLLPVFIEVSDEDFLNQLGYEDPNREMTRWDLMILDDDDE